MIIKINQKHLDLLSYHRIYLNASAKTLAGWLKVGDSYNTTGTAWLEPYSACLIGPRLSSVGAFSHTRSYFPPNMLTIGRYASIATKCALLSGGHPMNHAGMSGWTYSHAAPFGQYERDIGFMRKKASPNLPIDKVTIGHDVWIGQDVLIKPGVTIGNGAVVGARSVVTRDVPPYAVVAGSPAVVRRYRFDEDTVARFGAAQWWDYGYEQFAGMDTTDPLAFLDAFEDAKATGSIMKRAYEPVEMHKLMRAVT